MSDNTGNGLSDGQVAGIVFLCIGLIVDGVTGVIHLSETIWKSIGGYAFGYGLGSLISLIGLLTIILTSVLPRKGK